MQMSFGKHKGLEVHQLPESYMMWLVEQDFFHERFSALAACVIDELKKRGVPGSYFDNLPGNGSATLAAKGPIKKVEEIVIDSLMARGMTRGEAVSYILRIKESGADEAPDKDRSIYD